MDPEICVAGGGAGAGDVEMMKGKIDIRVALKDGVSSLRQSYYTPPFKVANITEDKRSVLLQLMMMCSSPGILEGDDYVIRVELGEDSQLQLHTQSYQRLFQMKRGAAQSMEVRLGKGAGFFYLPHPTVPHGDAVFVARNKIFLSEGCRLVWGEVLTCGRKLSGEAFAYSKYHSITEVFLQDKLVLRDNVCLRPLREDVQAVGQLEGFTHQASLLLMGPAEAAGRIREYLSVQEGILSGVSEGPAGSLIVRLLGNKAEQLYECLCKLNLVY